jgi:hypothetical protein
MGWRLPPATGLAAKRVEVFARTVAAVLAWRIGPHGPNDVLDIGMDLLPGELSSELICSFKLRSEADATRIQEETARAVEDLADVTLVSVTGRRSRERGQLHSRRSRATACCLPAERRRRGARLKRAVMSGLSTLDGTWPARKSLVAHSATIPGWPAG